MLPTIYVDKLDVFDKVGVELPAYPVKGGCGKQSLEAACRHEMGGCVSARGGEMAVWNQRKELGCSVRGPP